MSNVSIKQTDCPKTVVIELSEAAARLLNAALESGGAIYARGPAGAELLNLSFNLDAKELSSTGHFEDGDFVSNDDEDGV